MRSDPLPARRIVVKLGSALLIRPDGTGVDQAFLTDIAAGIQWLRQQGREVVVVSSGAIALGVNSLKLASKPKALSQRQALAAIGQSLLMRAWRDCLGALDIVTAQVLLTHDDLGHRKRFLNARHTVRAILDYAAVPIINENDTVATEEIKLGDNDNLSAQICSLVSADLLIILSTFDGLFTADPAVDPHSKRIPLVATIDESIAKLVGTSITQAGTGGMATKLQAVRAATRHGTAAVIAQGRQSQVLQRLVEGHDIGTYFSPQEGRVRGKRHWLAFTLKPAGSLTVDFGAKIALVEHGRSLLPGGVTAAAGEFDVGDAVRILDLDGNEIARGLVSYTADEIRRIAGQRSDRIESLLGYQHGDEVVHRDDLVLL